MNSLQHKTTKEHEGLEEGAFYPVEDNDIITAEKGATYEFTDDKSYRPPWLSAKLPLLMDQDGSYATGILTTASAPCAFACNNK